MIAPGMAEIKVAGHDTLSSQNKKRDIAKKGCDDYKCAEIKQRREPV
jgi:hypothetical protein